MTPNQTIQIAPYSTYFSLVEGELYEDDDAYAFMEANPTWWANDASVFPAFKVFVRGRLLPCYEHCDHKERLNIKHVLQYLLNVDEFTPYEGYPNKPDAKEKRKSIAQRVLNSCQEAIAPSDGYMLCGWMWEMLFGDEDWHTDVSEWVVVEPEIERIVPKDPTIRTEMPKKSTWWRRLSGFMKG